MGHFPTLEVELSAWEPGNRFLLSHPYCRPRQQLSYHWSHGHSTLGVDVLWWHLKCALATLDYVLMGEREGMKGDKGLAWCSGLSEAL